MSLGITQIPPDLIRLINSDLTVQEILQRCTVNKQFYAAICQNLNFWQALARQRRIPEDRIVGKDIRDLQQLIHNYERRPRLFDINRLALPDPQTGGPQKLIPFTVYRRVAFIDTAFDSILDAYRRTVTTRNRVKPIYRPGIAIKGPTTVSSEEFARRLEEVKRRVREYDFLHIDYTNYIVTKNRDRLTIEPFDLTFFSMKPAYLLAPVYETNGRQPLTLDMVREYFPAEINIKTVTDWYQLGDTNDPVIERDGFPIHVRGPKRRA